MNNIQITYALIYFNSKNPNFLRLLDRFAALNHVELLVDAFQVCFDGFGCNEQFVGNLLVRQPSIVLQGGQDGDTVVALGFAEAQHVLEAHLWADGTWLVVVVPRVAKGGCGPPGVAQQETGRAVGVL